MKDKDKWLKRQRGKIDFLIDNKNGFQYNALKNYTKKQWSLPWRIKESCNRK